MEYSPLTFEMMEGHGSREHSLGRGRPASHNALRESTIEDIGPDSRSKGISGMSTHTPPAKQGSVRVVVTPHACNSLPNRHEKQTEASRQAWGTSRTPPVANVDRKSHLTATSRHKDESVLILTHEWFNKLVCKFANLHHCCSRCPLGPASMQISQHGTGCLYTYVYPSTDTAVGLTRG